MMTAIRGWFDVAVAALATVAVLSLTLLIGRKASPTPRRKLPPGPRGWPVLGSLPSVSAPPHQALYELSKQYGPLMVLHLGFVRTLVVTSHKFAEEILKTHDKIMSSRPVPIVAREVSYNAVSMGWAPYGHYWRYVRKVGTVGLLTATRISQFREIREGETMAVLHFLLEESQRGNTVNMSACFSAIALNNITEMLMSKRFCIQSSGSNSRSLPKDIKDLFEVLGAFNIADYIPVLKPFDPQGLLKRTKAVHGKWDKFLEEIIDEHRQRRSTGTTENYKEDFVDALLGLGHTKEFEESLSMDSVKAILLELLAAGGETSASTSVWALAELVKRPHLLRKVQEELDSVVGQNRLVQEEDLPKLHYLNAVVKETLRLHPPVPLLVPHESIEDCEIEGFHIPARTRVFVNVWAIQKDPAVWERPLEFDPVRFLNSTKDFKGQDFDLLPFGSGRRMCPGMKLGALIVMYPLSFLLHALNWTLPDGQNPEELDMSEAFALALYKKIPLTVFGKARLPHHVLYPSQLASEAGKGAVI